MIIGIDLAKNIFQIHAADEQGNVLFRRKLRRAELMEFIAKQPQCLIAMEACGGAHYWGRKFRMLGYEVKLIAARHVKPFCRSQKNDRNDSEAIAEAASRPRIPTVAVKEEWQQEMCAIHRIREGWVKRRTAIRNELHGLFLEFGYVLPKPVSKLVHEVNHVCETHEFTIVFKELVEKLLDELKTLDKRISQIDWKLEVFAKSQKDCAMLLKLEGVGPITATAAPAIMGNPAVFRNGRQFAAWLGLVPRQESTGGKTVLLGITKRGDPYLRKLLIHGSRALIKKVTINPQTKRHQWLKQKYETKGYNRAAVAYANHNARKIWAVMAGKTAA